MGAGVGSGGESEIVGSEGFCCLGLGVISGFDGEKKEKEKGGGGGVGSGRMKRGRDGGNKREEGIWWKRGGGDKDLGVWEFWMSGGGELER